MTNKTQMEKFRQAAREAGADEDEAAFDAKLKSIAKAKPENKDGDSAGSRRKSTQ